ncbi:hypothetical protein CHLRE_02g110200v5 [Chlamydomonas reinhardtii]|uniref:Uncharacterized protein n=1 Tax=Chlamydomonas reinhardtii TaxID=3055 RepID=A0A2K3E2X8_CHLRE|nr:uncharacterized protein CHLRE_02g110200v5 [Chlamydomonas reinhardtii]PNW87128.1 hypothetical protein CHLRE_02g110200v5 [Chlamydomonas reinhardtii]
MRSLRNVAAPARHAAACHADEDWREAGAAVADACAKYEAFIFQTADRELLSKLELTEQRLAVRLRQQDAQQVEQPQARSAGVHSAAVLNRQLRLCRLLRRSFLRGGAGLLGDGDGGGSEEDLGHLYAVRTAPSGAQERLTRLLAAEREAVAAVATAVALGPGRLAVPLRVLSAALSTGTSDVNSCAASSHDRNCSSGSSGAGSAVGAKPAGTAISSSADTSAAATLSPELMAPIECDPLLGPMLAAAKAAGVPVEATGLPLTPANLRNLLRRHPASAVRRAAYEHGLVPRVEAAVGALGRVAEVRGQVAALMGFSSFVDYSYSRGGMAVAGADAVAELLQELVFALLPVAREEIEQLKCAVGAAAGAAPEATAASAAGTAGSQAGSAASKLDAASGGAAAGTGLHPNALEPWDVEYAQAEWVRQRPSPLPDAAQLAPYMQLRGVLAGLSDLLHELMGVQLRLEAVGEVEAAGEGAEEGNRTEVGAGAGTAQRGQSSSSGSGGPGHDLWGPQVLRLSIWATAWQRDATAGPQRPVTSPNGEPAEQHDRQAGTAGSRARGGCINKRGRGTAEGVQMRGVMYLDLGSGYGTRQLRFPAGGVDAGSRADGAAADAGALLGQQEARGGGMGALPAVAVGLKWEWRDGVAESPAALHELLHEVGHALHLTLSSSAAAAQPFLSADASATATSANSGLGTSTAASGAEGVMHFGGLQLPLDVLEVPSSLLQTLAYDPAALARICRRVGSSGGAVRCAAGPSESGIPEAGLGQAAELAEAGVGARIGSREPLGDPMPRHLAEAVAAHLAAENCSGIGTLGKVLASLFDQLLHSGVLEEKGGGRGGAAAAGVALGLWRAVRRAFGAMPTCDATLRELAALPALAHHQATFHSYLVGLLVASTARGALPLQAVNTSRDKTVGSTGSSSDTSTAWDMLRREIFEAGADRDVSELVEGWLRMGAPSSTARCDTGGEAAAGLGVSEGERGLPRDVLTLTTLARVGGTLVAIEG